MSLYKIPLGCEQNVREAFNSLIQQGVNPTVRAIQNHLGGGSPNDIAPQLRKLKDEIANQPKTPITLDPRISQVIDDVVRKAVEAARAELQQMLDEEIETVNVLTQAGKEAESTIADLNNQLLEVANVAKKQEGSIEQLKRSEAECKQEIDRLISEREQLKLELTRAEVQSTIDNALKDELAQLRSELKEAMSARSKLEGILEERSREAKPGLFPKKT